MTKTLYFDCSRGASGDMICAALYELAADKEKALDKLNNLGLPEVEFIPTTHRKYDITGTSMQVMNHGEEEGGPSFQNGHTDPAQDHTHEHTQAHEDVHTHVHGHAQTCKHHHMTLHQVKDIINGLHIEDTVKHAAFEIYDMIAGAESAAHQCTVEEVHFHEVGAMDAIADITAACVLMEEIRPQKTISTAVQVGGGTVKCAHGILPVPAPATANILKGLPLSSGYIEEELCTPTGAALIRFFTDEFCDSPQPKKAIQTGIGLGKKTFEKLSYFAASILE